MMRNVRRGKGQPVEEAAATEEITPQPGFVIKTSDESGRKVFVNVCSSDRIPAPGGWEGGLLPAAVEDALAKADALDSAEALRFPMSVGSLRPDADKAGAACGAADVVVSTAVLAAAGASRPLKAFLIDLVLSQVGSKHGLQLDPKYKLPKMGYKGAGGPGPQRVRAERRALVTEVPAGGAARTVAATAGGKGQQQPPQRQKQEAAATEAPPRGPLPYLVDFEGRPVQAVVLTVQLGSGGGVAAADVRAEVAGQDVFVSVPGREELAVQLPLAVTAEGARAALEWASAGKAGGGGGGQLLRLRLPYLPLRRWVDDMAAATPHAFGGLPVAGDEYLELA
ncbi:MAG: pre-RNA processing PIH1/Nop17-domain-containing protein [Monoraphidium minutum]|nr:MAG: pre-RNA processing PIH1/Nop17-domain-containing protein [Monoraphidium minutum]